jgi:hypothetical protein
MGEIPPMGHVPPKMYAWTIRRERHGEPDKAFEVEVVDTWSIDSNEVLVLVMAAGVNYNGVWAGLGQPISPFDGHGAPYHIAGSDAAGIVWAVGDKVKNWKVGDEVVIHCNQDDGNDEECNGGDPMFSPTQRIWGYETPDGSFSQFTRVQAQQLMPRPKHLTWEESACYTLTLATAYRMLFGHHPHELKPGQNVLIWGASGGLGVLRDPARQHRGRQRHRGDLRRGQARLRHGSRRQGRHQPQGLQLLGPAAQGEHARIQGMVHRGAQVRQGDLGHHRQGRECRHGLRTPRRGDLPGLHASCARRAAWS